jgi:hypothetical protein
MFRSLSVAFAAILTSSAVAHADSVPITGNVSSKCTIYTDTVGVYGNPTPDVLSTDPFAGGVLPVVRYDVTIADYYTAKIAWPMSFSTAPALTDALNWDGSVEVQQVSDVHQSDYETYKVMYDNVTEYDLTAAGSVWFKVTSEVTYGYGKSLPGGEYTASVVAECIAK